MGFNWAFLTVYLVAMAAAEFFIPNQQIANLMLVVLAITMVSSSRVGRHNARQALRKNGHQWVGDGPTCEECDAQAQPQR